MTDDRRDLPYWIAFSLVPTVGPVRVGLLEERFGSLEAAWGAPESELAAAGLTTGAVDAVAQVRKVVEPEREMERTLKAGVAALTWHSPEYPRLLRDIADPPPVLYVKGEIDSGDDLSVAVVGTRRATAYGKQAAKHLAGDLARSGLTVVSGLARGIDGVAHQAALDAGGRTLAVMGSGLDVVYPPEHRALLGRVLESGAALSECPLGAKPDARNFPRRNRLLSGLSRATLVIEAPEDSGVMSTVKSALEQNREVLCVPGSIYSPNSGAPNRLIKEGAKLVMSAEDVLEELNIRAVAPPEPLPGLSPAPDSEEEARLLEALAHEPRHIDELSRAAGVPIVQATSALALMEMKGSALQVGRMHYIRARTPAGSRRS